MERRIFLVGLGAAFLAGCEDGTSSTKRPSPEPVYGHGVFKPGSSDKTALAPGDTGQQLADGRRGSSLKVVEVSVDTSAIEGVQGRAISVPPAQIGADIRSTLLASLGNNAGDRPVKVNLLVERVVLVSPGQSMLVGGVSTITGTMWIVDARNGAVLMKPATVRGTAKGGWVGGGLIGVALTKEPQEDYRATVAGFAADVRKRLFGKQT
jgi:hypothetical protein